MSQSFISIIMPAYNAEQYIQESINSIRLQSWKDWKLIIVNDGSRDRTPELCDYFETLDTRIKVIHQKNRGVSDARNAGLKKADGEFVTFVDADDILPPESLKTRIDLISDADFAIGGMELFDSYGNILETMPMYPCDTWNHADAVNYISAKREFGYQGYLVNKLFRRQIIEEQQIRFDERLCFNEDRLFCTRYALHADKAKLSNKLVYRYRITDGNATSVFHRMKDKDYDRFMTEFLAFDEVLKLVSGIPGNCRFHVAVDAMYQAVKLKKSIKKTEKRLIRGLNQQIRKYGRILLQAPPEFSPLWKKVMVLGHMVFLT